MSNHRSKITCLLLLLLAYNLNVYAVEKISVIGLFKDQAVLKIDGKQRSVKKGKRTPEGVLLISANSEQAVLEINGERRTMKLGTNISNRFKNTTKKTTVTIAPNAWGSYRVNGSINGFQIEFLVDTGATFISMNRHVAKRVGINYKLDGEKSRASTANGITDIYIVKLKKVKVGDIELRDIDGSVHDNDFPDVVLLGNAFLKKVNMQQREGGMLILQK